MSVRDSQQTAVRVALALVFGMVLSAQTPTAEIAGRITDSTGAAVPRVTVTATNMNTGVQRQTITPLDGYYTVPLLRPGEYRITIEKEGFRTVIREGIQLVVRQVARIDFVLAVGAVTETVTVTAAAPLLESETATIGQLVDSKRIQEIPLRGRNPYGLVGLIPGARVPVSWQDLPVDMNLSQYASIGGARGNQNEFLLDGVPNTNVVSSGPNIFPSPDSLQEFKVETSSHSAEYGRAAGGVFSVVTKSGTNTLHGSAWEFHRDQRLNANDFFANRAGLRKPVFTFNQFGATLGGPVRRDKTFFFGSYEGARQRQGIVYLGQVPTAAERAGDFSEVRTAQGQPILIYDPLTSRSDPASPGRSIRDAFSNQIVPRTRQSKVALALQDYLPLPNTRGSNFTNAGNFISANSDAVNKDIFMVKVDHAVSRKQSLGGSVHYDRAPWNRPNAYGNVATPTWGPQVFERRGVVVDDTYTLNPTTVLDFRYGLSRLTNLRLPLSYGLDITTLGFPASYASATKVPSVPEIAVVGFAGSFSGNPVLGNQRLLGASDVIIFGLDTHSWNGSVSRVQGKHSLKAGIDFRLIRSNTWQVTEKVFSFDRAFVQGPDPTRASTTAGYGYASFLLGTPAGGTTALSPAIAAQYQYYAGYVQDTFRATPRLTLNLGLRYEYSAPRTDRFNQLTNFDVNGAVPLAAPGLNLRGVLQFPATGGLPRGQTNPDRNNFAPRFGLSYQISRKTVVRGGGGVFYAPLQSGTGADGLSGFSAQTAVLTSLDGITPLDFLDNPYPRGIVQPTGGSLGSKTLLGQSVAYVQRGEVTPYSLQWNADVQHQLPGAVLFDVAYVGSRGVKLAGGRTWNQLPDQYLGLGNDLRTLVANPFFGQIAQGPLGAATVARAQLLRPFPQFGDVTAASSGFGNSIYHSLQVKAEKQFAKGLTFLASYTFSKLIDDVGGPFAGEATGAAGIQNWNNLRAERAVSNLDQPHSLVASYIWELPWGPGKRFIGGDQGVIGKIVGGWQVQGVTAFQSGSAIGVSASPNTTFSQGGGQRANWTGNSANLGSAATIDRWFDTSQFSAPAPYTFGTASRSMGNVRAAGTRNFDFTIAKNTSIREEHRIQFRAEFFNLFNTPWFSPPGGVLGTPTFGIVSSQMNRPRVIQLGLKYSF